MSQEKTGPDATPRIGLDLGRQIFDEPGAGHQQEKSGAGQERIRQRAYQIWEDEGRSGDPQDHWYRAERELSESTTQERSEAIVEDATPAAAVEAVETVTEQSIGESATQKKSRRKKPS
jgi:hypothetical protein